MIVADRRKAIYIHIEKTGGSSITALLAPYISEKYRDKNPRVPGSGFGWRQTWHINDEHDKFAQSILVLDKFGIDPQKYFKFTIVRNPYSWILSIWRNRYKSPMNVKNTLTNRLRFQISEFTGIRRMPSQHFHHMYPDGSFKSFILFIDYLTSNFPPSFTKRYLGANDQYSYIENDRNIKFDFIGKLENFEQDVKQIRRIIHLNYNSGIPHVNKKRASNKHNYLKYYNNQSLEIVNRVFARDFDFFKYQTILNPSIYIT